MLNTLVFSIVYEHDGVCPGGHFSLFSKKQGKSFFFSACEARLWTGNVKCFFNRHWPGKLFSQKKLKTKMTKISKSTFENLKKTEIIE